MVTQRKQQGHFILSVFTDTCSIIYSQ